MEENNKHWIFTANAHIPWLLMIALTSLQSSMSGSLLQYNIMEGVDKIIHFMIFGLLGWTMSRGFNLGGNTFLRKNWLWFALILCAIYAVLDEIHQGFTPGRSPDLYDWIADYSGVIVFSLLYRRKIIKGERA